MVLWGFLGVVALVILGVGALVILGVGVLVILGVGVLVVQELVLWLFRGWSFGSSGGGCSATW